jgi:demethylmenaquinone methyltransferase/2-methoxy-6-polyprenyl-1,4-benzoquinol methylase
MVDLGLGFDFDFGPGDVRFFDRVAPLYDRLMPPADADALADALSVSRRPVRTVLDVAGGTGRAARVLSGLVDADADDTGGVAAGGAGDADPGGETDASETVERGHGVVVVDRSRGMLRVARARGHECVAADATHLPVPDDAVDAVTVVDALHHVRDQRALLAEARRVVAPGGVVVVVDFDPTTLRGRALVALERAVGFDSTFSTPDDLARFLDREGFVGRVVDPGFGYVVVGRVE